MTSQKHKPAIFIQMFHYLHPYQDIGLVVVQSRYVDVLAPKSGKRITRWNLINGYKYLQVWTHIYCLIDVSINICSLPLPLCYGLLHHVQMPNHYLLLKVEFFFEYLYFEYSDTVRLTQEKHDPRNCLVYLD